MLAAGVDYSAYRERNTLLKELGYADYGAYLKSNLWKRIRTQVLGMHKCKCACCGKPAFQVHHLQYSRAAMLGENLLHLAPVCRDCHESAEVRDGIKRSVEQANETLRRRVLKRLKRSSAESSQRREGNLGVKLAQRMSWRSKRRR